MHVYTNQLCTSRYFSRPGSYSFPSSSLFFLWKLWFLVQSETAAKLMTEIWLLGKSPSNLLRRKDTLGAKPLQE